MSEPRDTLAFIFECPYCGVKHLHERYDHVYFYADEIRWSDFSNEREKVSDCGSCAKAFSFRDVAPVRMLNTNVNAKRYYKPGEAALLDCIRKRYFSKEETKINGEPIPYTIAMRTASSVLESGNYTVEFEKNLRLMVWWEYNALMKTHPAFTPELLSLPKKIKRQVDLLSTRISNAKRARALRSASEANLKRLLELNPDDISKLEIYRNLGMFKEAKEIFRHEFNSTRDDDEDQFHWTFMRELNRRLKKRDRKTFGLKPTFKIVD